MFCEVVGNILSLRFRSFLLMYAFSICSVFVFSFSVLPTQCFALVMFTVPFSRSMSLVFSHVSSIGLVPRSFDIERNSAILVLAFDISIFIFSSVGIFGSLSFLL